MLSTSPCWRSSQESSSWLGNSRWIKKLTLSTSPYWSPSQEPSSRLVTPWMSERSLFGFGNWVTTLDGLIVFMWDTQVISPQVHVCEQSSHMWWWRSSLHMRHDIESCDQGREDQDMTWLNGPVASVKGKIEWWLSADGPRQWWRASEVKIDEPIWSCDDMKWIISLLIVLMHVLHRHWRRWNGMHKAKV